MSTTITRNTDAKTIVPALVLAGWTTEQEAGTIVHDVLGRTIPDVTLRPAGPRRGTMNLFFLDADSAEEARKFHSVAAVYRTVSSMSWIPVAFVVAGGTLRLTQTTENNARWRLEVPYVEVAA